MKPAHVFRIRFWLMIGVGIQFLGNPVARAAEGAEDITAVNSRVSRDYVRKRLPDGSFQPEE
jgi:hypothetical protein